MRSHIVLDLSDNPDTPTRLRVTSAEVGTRLHVSKTPRGLLIELVPPPPAPTVEEPA